jgi:HAD superfamily hydrolase (TIGR01662 family)
VGASQGRIRVPLPTHRRPTDWERSTAGLEVARWATADMAYRRVALLAVDGFDERFPRAYREDADLALRVRQAGWRLTAGQREVEHPVRPTGAATSVRVQRGNADDALMRRLHGPTWREQAGTGRGLFRRHAGATGALLMALVAAPVTGRSPAARVAAATGGATYLLHVADLVRRRVLPGPRTPRETATMTWTSVVIPAAAVWHRGRGWWRHRSAAPWPPVPRAVLLDRDGTIVHDVPYNADPAAVEPVPGAHEALDRLRAAGLRLGVVTNQSGVGQGLLSTDQVDAVNAEVDARLGPFETWQVCPHAPGAECACRKPRPGLVRSAARHLGVRPEECVVIGDIGADAEAARAAGARSVLVPTPVTRPEEVAAAPVVASDLGRAVDIVLGWRHG